MADGQQYQNTVKSVTPDTTNRTTNGIENCETRNTGRDKQNEMSEMSENIGTQDEPS